MEIKIKLEADRLAEAIERLAKALGNSAQLRSAITDSFVFGRGGVKITKATSEELDEATGVKTDPTAKADVHPIVEGVAPYLDKATAAEEAAKDTKEDAPVEKRKRRTKAEIEAARAAEAAKAAGVDAPTVQESKPVASTAAAHPEEKLSLHLINVVQADPSKLDVIQDWAARHGLALNQIDQATEAQAAEILEAVK